MRKNALTISAFVVAAGAFGSFFRWLQNQAAFDKETGLLEPSALNILLPLIIIGAAVLFYFLIKSKKAEGLEPPTDIFSIFCGTSIFYLISFWAIAVITTLGGLITLFKASDYAFAGAYRIIALLAIGCGVTFPLICSCARRLYAPSIICIFMTLPIVMFCIWLVACYKTNSSNPTIWAYAIEIITVCLAIIAFYYTAGFPYGKADPYRSMYFAMLAAFMCIVSLADSRSFGLQLVLVGTAGMLIMENWMLIRNMKEPEAKPEATPEVKEPEAKPEETEAEETGTVIEAGEADNMSEPTIQAPEYKSQLDDTVNEILEEYKKSVE